MVNSNTLLGRTTTALGERYDEIKPFDDVWLDQLASAALEHVAAEITAMIELNEHPPTAEDLARMFLHASQDVASFPPPWRPGGGGSAA